MQSKLIILSWFIVVGILLQSCSAAPAAPPASVPVATNTQAPATVPAATNTRSLAVAGLTETPAASATVVPTLAKASQTPAPSLTPSKPAASQTPTATLLLVDPWLITAENLGQFTPLAHLAGSSLDQINLAVWSPDGLRLAVGGKTGVVMLDAANWKVLWRLEFPDTVRLQFSRDGSRLLVSGINGAPGMLLETASGKTMAAQLAGRLALSPDGKTVAGAGILDALSRDLLRELEQPKVPQPDFDSPEEIAFSQDGRKLVEGSNGCGFTAWDTTSGGITYHVAGNDPYNTGQGKSANSDWMVVVCAITSNNFSNVSLQANFINLNRPNGFGRFIFPNVANYQNHHFALLPDRPLIAWTDGNKITLYDLAAGFQPLRTLPGLPADGNLSFSPGTKDQRMAYWKGRNLQIWDVTFPKKVAEFGGQPVTDIAFSPKDGRLLAFGSEDGKLALWNVAAQEQLFLYQAHRRGRVAVAFEPGGTGLASGGSDYAIRLWRLDQPDPAPLIEQEVLAGVAQIAYNPGGTRLVVTYSSAFYVHIYSGSLDQNEPLQTVPIRNSEQFILSAGVAFSPNGDKLAIGNTIGAVELHNPANGALIKSFDGLRRGVARRLAFSADGLLLAASTRGVWNLKTFKLLVELTSDNSSVAISPDQCLFAAGQNDGTLRLWNLKTGQSLEPLKVFESGIEDLAFSPDGRLLALGSQDGDVVIWGIPNALEQPEGSVPKVRCGQ